MPEQPDLTALVASRICHDLISPIGAIGNGVELLALEEGAMRPELALISESVANANARIRFFRVSFGAASRDQRIARSEVLSILTDLGRGGRVSYAWTSSGDLARQEVRLVFLMLQCMESALAYGGRIDITQTEDGWTIVAEASRLKVDQALWDRIAAPETFVDVVAGQVHFALFADELARQGLKLAADFGERTLRVRF